MFLLMLVKTLFLGTLFSFVTFAIPKWILFPLYDQWSSTNSTCQAGMAGLWCSFGFLGFILQPFFMGMIGVSIFLLLKFFQREKVKRGVEIVCFSFGTVFVSLQIFAVSVLETDKIFPYVFFPVALLSYTVFFTLRIVERKSYLLLILSALIFATILILAAAGIRVLQDKLAVQQTTEKLQSLTFIEDPKVFLDTFNELNDGPAEPSRQRNVNWLSKSPYYPYDYLESKLLTIVRYPSPQGGDCSDEKELRIDENNHVFWLETRGCSNEHTTNRYGPYRYSQDYVFVEK